MGLQFLFMDDNAPCHRTVAAEQLLRVRILNVWIGRHDLGSQSHRAFLPVVCLGLKITRFEVPSLVIPGDSAILTCFYDLGKEKLYSVKWYKDQVEFFRFFPSLSPQYMAFPAPGLNIDNSFNEKKSAPFRHKKVQPDERMTGQKDNLVALYFKYDFWHRTATAGSDVVNLDVQFSDDVFQHLWPYIDNNTANVVFQMVKRLWLIRIDQ
ncbi:uncharacterized protein TNCV_4290251 [Trichonephila clavipes]|nr:uncharacterized protein TNCV_4290251 [Trichonephila clavipes]